MATLCVRSRKWAVTQLVACLLGIGLIGLGGWMFSHPSEVDQWTAGPGLGYWSQLTEWLHEHVAPLAVLVVSTGAILVLTSIACAPIARYARRRTALGNLCPKCTYPLNQAGKCSECGHGHC